MLTTPSEAILKSASESDVAHNGPCPAACCKSVRTYLSARTDPGFILNMGGDEQYGPSKAKQRQWNPWTATLLSSAIRSACSRIITPARINQRLGPGWSSRRNLASASRFDQQLRFEARGCRPDATLSKFGSEFRASTTRPPLKNVGTLMREDQKFLDCTTVRYLASCE